MEGSITGGAPHAVDGSAGVQRGALPEKGETLAPPEWSGSSPPSRGRSLPPPIARRTARHAEEARLRARARLAEVRGGDGDAAAEGERSAHLARWLAARERDLDEAVALARRALALEEQGAARARGGERSGELRRELSAWLESLGETSLAAGELGVLAERHEGDARAVAAILVRVGVLHARAGDAVAARDALEEASRLDAHDALACELKAALGGWAPDVVSAEVAAAAYVTAADRRGASAEAGEDAELEDLFRAFEAAPGYEPAARALSGALAGRGEASAGDEIWRAHADALGRLQPERARQVHALRRANAVEADEIARALGAALDEGLDRAIEGEDAARFDALLARAGLFEVLAERLEARAERAEVPRERGRAYEDLARLYAGPLANPSRAALAHVRTLATMPGHAASTAALEAYASSSRDTTPLVEGLVRAVAVQDGGDAELRAGRLASARLLAQIAEERTGDPGVAMWAFEKALEMVPDDAAARMGVKRVSARLNALYAELVRARNELGSGAPATRAEALRKIAGVLHGLPGESDVLAEVLAELARHERRFALEAARIAARRGDRREVARLAREQMDDPEASPDGRIEARMLLATAARAAGDVADANEASRALLELGPVSREAASAAWTNAALAGDEVTRARAIALIAPGSAPAVCAALLACASEALLRAGNVDEARRAAEGALHAAPDDPRAVGALARAACAGARRDRLGAAAIERAISILGPTSAWCGALALALQELGEPDTSVSWTLRLIALRPGDFSALRLLIDRLARPVQGGVDDGADATDDAKGESTGEPTREPTGDVTRAASRAEPLADALGWALSQPQPARVLADVIADGLRALSQMDAEKAVVIARRAIEVLGPRHRELREAMLEAADRARDDAFGAALLERWLAAGAPADEHRALLAALVERRARAGDQDGEIRAIARAIAEGVPVVEFAERLDAFSPAAVDGDGELALLAARAELATARGEVDLAASAWRELGGAVWDLTGDRARALEAWVRAAEIAPTGGYTVLVIDAARFADPAFALDRLDELVAREADPVKSAVIAASGARAALALGEPSRAFELARTALAKEPALGEALEIAERGAAAVDRMEEMTALYDTLAGRSLGRFGRRAAHYRGARFFERRERLDLAVKHAAEAFAAVPSEGNTLALLSRTAERAHAQSVAVRAVEQVAELAVSPRARAAWLLRAAALTGGGEEGVHQRFDVLLRAVVLAPESGTLAFLRDAARALLALAPDSRDVVQMRLARAGDALAKKSDGPEGARVALAFAELSLDLFDDADGAVRALERAFAADGDLEEYARLVPKVALLARADEAPRSLARVMDAAQKPYANVGVPALRMLGALAGALGDASARAKALVMAVEKDEEDDALVWQTDEALASCRDEELTARFKKKVPEERRVESLRAHAREEAAAGRHDAAIHALERAVLSAGDDARKRIQADLHEAYDAVGFSPEMESRLLREAKNETVPAVVRADAWAEIAHGREGLGDLGGAAEALERATELDPEPRERWSEVERVAELAGRADLRVVALRHLRAHFDGELGGEALPTMKRLARALEVAGHVTEAESTWREVFELAPDDEDVDRALEALITSRGDYEELASHLARRAERLGARSGTREALRAVRLRRAAILEQRLDRAREACEELELVLAEWPDNQSALCFLADLYERTGEPARAIPLWQRVAALTPDPDDRAEVMTRGARASLAAGELEPALDRVRQVLAQRPSDAEALALRVEIARALESTRELGEALAELALASSEDASTRSDMLVEAAQAAARGGDMVAALERAQRAAAVAPHRAKTQLFARGLEYRVRGAGAPEEARRTLEALDHIEEPLDVEDAALQTFLLAEALDAVQGGGAGLRKLSERYAELGAHPLVAVGMAERLVAQWNFATALPLFDAALRGNLLGLRRRGAVALAAGEAAVRAERHEEALQFLDEAAADPESRIVALRRIAQLAAAGGDVARSRKVLLELARSAAGAERARTLAQLGRVLFTSSEAEERTEAIRVFVEAIDAAEGEPDLAAQLEGELAELKKRQSVAPQALVTWPPPELALRKDLAAVVFKDVLKDESAEAPESVMVMSPGSVRLQDLEKAIERGGDPKERAARRVALASAKLEGGESEDAEKLLWQALADGSLQAGELLAAQLAMNSARASDLVRVRRQLVDMVPGDLVRLEALMAAALADHHGVYARAIEHVIRAFSPDAAPLAPPPLSAQGEQPRLLNLLARHSYEPAGEALSAVWEGAASVFARTPASYALTGLERVVPGASSVIARLYEIAVRLLDLPRIPLFVRRGATSPSWMVALLQPPSAILSGDARDDSADLRFALGQALSAALAPNALVLGHSETEARALWGAIVGAFGPPDGSGDLDPPSAKLAASFWQILPSRTQRRLQELLAVAHATSFELVVERARQSGRRVGLFLTGDFGHAARTLVREQGAIRVEELGEPGGLVQACAAVPSLADLFRLAVRPEYADARWHAETPAPRHRPSDRIRVL